MFFLPFIPTLLTGLITVYVVKKILTADIIADTVRDKNNEAFKALIMEKKKTAVKVGVFDVDDEHITDMEIKSDRGVSAEIEVGQVIYC